MDDNMIERVARAICAENDDYLFDDLPEYKAGWTRMGERFRDVNEPTKLDYRIMAEVVIRAMREPTADMWVAGRDPILAREVRTTNDVLRKCSWFNPIKDVPLPYGEIHTKGAAAVWVWRAMIDAALSGD